MPQLFEMADKYGAKILTEPIAALKEEYVFRLCLRKIRNVSRNTGISMRTNISCTALFCFNQIAGTNINAGMAKKSNRPRTGLFHTISIDVKNDITIDKTCATAISCMLSEIG